MRECQSTLKIFSLSLVEQGNIKEISNILDIGSIKYKDIEDAVIAALDNPNILKLFFDLDISREVVDELLYCSIEDDVVESFKMILESQVKRSDWIYYLGIVHNLLKNARPEDKEMILDSFILCFGNEGFEMMKVFLHHLPYLSETTAEEFKKISHCGEDEYLKFIKHIAEALLFK